MKHTWRLLNYSSKDPTTNLAIEEAILRRLVARNAPNTFAFGGIHQVLLLDILKIPIQKSMLKFARNLKYQL